MKKVTQGKLDAVRLLVQVQILPGTGHSKILGNEFNYYN